MASYLLKASADDFDRWRLASVRAGFPSLAAYLRAAADEGVSAAGRVDLAVRVAGDSVGPEVLTRQGADGGLPAVVLPAPVPASAVAEFERKVAAAMAARPEREFKPDPRPVTVKKGRR